MTKEKETANVENINVEQTEQEAQRAEDVTKARQVLRARFEGLASNGLSFEKRTGNFFRSVIVQEIEQDGDGNDRYNKKGEPIYKRDERGEVIERARRLVIDMESDEAKPENRALFEELSEEIEQKRAAAFVETAEREEKKLQEERAKALALVEEINETLKTFNDDYKKAAEIVRATTLPEKQPRIALRDRLSATEDENTKLRQMLIAAGINPDGSK